MQGHFIRILITLVLLYYQMLAFANHGTKLVVAVSASDCANCTLILEQILQNGKSFDTVFVFFDSKEHKKLLERKYKESSNIVFQHKNPLDSLLIKPGYSSVHVYTASSYQRLFLKSIKKISQLIEPPLNKKNYTFQSIEVDQNSFLISSNGQTTILYNKYSNILHSTWHSSEGYFDHEYEYDNSISFTEFKVAIDFFNSDSEIRQGNSELETSFDAYLIKLNQFGMPAKNVQSIALLDNHLLLFTQLNLLLKKKDAEEFELQPYDLIYIFKIDADNKLLERETVIPVFSSSVHKNDATFIINSFSKHQVVNSTMIYSSAISVANNHINRFDLDGIGILYNVETLKSKNNYLIALNPIEINEIDFELLGKAHAKNSLLISDQNNVNYLYNRLINKAFDLSSKSRRIEILEPKAMISKITGNKLQLEIGKIFACENISGKLALMHFGRKP